MTVLRTRINEVKNKTEAPRAQSLTEPPLAFDRERHTMKGWTRKKEMLVALRKRAHTCTSTAMSNKFSNIVEKTQTRQHLLLNLAFTHHV
jgi:hypothetical protein